MFISRSREDTAAWAEQFATTLTPGAVVALTGELGAGKTVVAKAIGKALGVTEDILSPTFNYILEYRGRVPFYHADLYRLNSVADFRALGLDEYFEKNGIFVIEWAERIRDILPVSAVSIHLRARQDENEREIMLLSPA
jgi:tRNA threonylcarbamoyladenosine biosynthesis protein TsaE